MNATVVKAKWLKYLQTEIVINDTYVIIDNYSKQFSSYVLTYT